MKELTLVVTLQLVFVAQVRGWNEGKVLLRDLQVLSLYRGRFTAARRSSPVLQLQCVGGSAGCSAFVPEVVQCQNKGWDGLDVQWECKTDMDNAYRFGKVEVSCEGFSHPDDPYILAGSCGLEYTVELTREGRAGQSSSGGFSDFASSFFSSSGHHGNKQHHHQGGGGGDSGGGLLVVAVLLLLAYGVYKLFLGQTATHAAGYHGDAPGQGAGYHGDQPSPPPPGFRPDYTASSSGFAGGYPGDQGYQGYQGSGAGYGFHSDYTRPHYPGGRGTTGGGGGGFWTGMGTGGVLGYLFGSQRRQPHTQFFSNTSYSQPRTSAPSTPTSTGTRTASGFGGTKRR